jgi:putative hemolysin
LDPDLLSYMLNFLVIHVAFASNILVLTILLACSALISGAEVALFGLSVTEINTINGQKTPQGNILVTLLDRPKKLLATILIANNAINISIVLLFNVIGDTLFSNVTEVLFGLVSLRFILEVIVATFLILMFGEILPKVYANRTRMSFSGLSVKNLGFSIFTTKFTYAFRNYFSL